MYNLPGGELLPSVLERIHPHRRSGEYAYIYAYWPVGLDIRTSSGDEQPSKRIEGTGLNQFKLKLPPSVQAHSVLKGSC